MPKIVELTDKMIEQIATFRAQAYSNREIARQIGITHQTLKNWLDAGKTAKSGKKKSCGKHGIMLHGASYLRQSPSS